MLEEIHKYACILIFSSHNIQFKNTALPYTV